MINSFSMAHAQTNICRLCLLESPVCFSLLKNNTDKILEALTSIKLKPTDDILMICLKCNLNLKLAYNIQQKIIKANEKLKEGFLHSLKIKQEMTIIKSEEVTIIDNSLIKSTEPDDNFIKVYDNPCLVCDLILDPNSINSHIKGHFNEDQFCDLCNQTFSNIRTYKKHLFKHPDYISHQCDKCEMRFQYKSLFNVHKDKVHCEIVQNEIKEEIHPLPETNKIKKSRGLRRNISDQIKKLENKGIGSELATKLATISQEKKLSSKKRKCASKDPSAPYTCNVCFKKFTERRQFHNHNHRRKPCPICKKEITSDNFSKHVKNHTCGPQICEQCGNTYINLESLRGHIFYKHRGKFYECKECQITFKNRQSLNGHRKREHTDKDSGHICENCGRKFIFSYDLKKHIKMTHLKMRPYICEFCNRGFSGLHAMKTHRRQHTNETPYKCEVCGEGFRQNVSLKAHRKSKHNIIEELTCECKICGKGFSSMHAVKAHMRCH